MVVSTVYLMTVLLEYIMLSRVLNTCNVYNYVVNEFCLFQIQSQLMACMVILYIIKLSSYKKFMVFIICHSITNLFL